MATAPEGIMALGQPATAGGPPPGPALLTRNDSYDVTKQALTQTRPDIAMELEERLAGFRAKAARLPADVLEALVDGFEEALNRKDDYAAFLEEVKEGAPALLNLFPPEYDEQFLSAMYFLLMDALRAKKGEQDVGEGVASMVPQQFARGGIAEAVQIVANQGRRDDTMLAHINPQEAQLLKALGGRGSINPNTGLYEYGSKFWRKLGDATIGEVKAVVDDFVSDARDFVRSDIGGIIVQVGLTYVLGPIMGPAFAAATAAGATTAMRGGDLKDVAKSAMLAGATAYLSSPGSPIHNAVSKYTPAFMNNPTVVSALTAQIVGTGAGLLQGQSLEDAAKNGFRDAAMTAAATYATGGSKAQVDDAAATSMSKATDAQLQKGASAELKTTPLEVDPLALTPADATSAIAPPPDMTPTPLTAADTLPENISYGKSPDIGFGNAAPEVGVAPRTLDIGFGNAAVDADSAGSAGTYGARTAPLNIEGTTPPTTAVADAFPPLNTEELNKLAAVSGDKTGTLRAATDIGQKDLMAAAPEAVSPAAAAVPDGGIGSLEKVPTVPESLKKIARGDVMEGLEDLFMPGSGPSPVDIVDSPEYKKLREAGYSKEKAIKALEKEYGTSFVRQYGPGATAGIAGLALAGGFDQQDQPKSDEQQAFEDRMRESTTDVMRRDPRRYYLQNVPGVAYNERGEVIGSAPVGPSYSIADITGGQGATGYSPVGQSTYMPSAFMSPYGEQYLNQGGIATLARGGYPRRIGQISGPGTETSDDIPAMLSDGEFVMTARAVRGMGNGSRREGARKMYALMHQLERNAARG